MLLLFGSWLLQIAFLCQGTLKTSQYERIFFVKQCQTTSLLNDNIYSHLTKSPANSYWRISSRKYFPIVAFPLYWLHSQNEHLRLPLTKTRLKWTNRPLISDKAKGQQTNSWYTYMPFACCFWYSIGFPRAVEQDTKPTISPQGQSVISSFQEKIV